MNDHILAIIVPAALLRTAHSTVLPEANARKHCCLLDEKPERHAAMYQQRHVFGYRVAV
jgi:hypothetical protein